MPVNLGVRLFAAISMSDPLEKYTRLGAIIGGALLGLLVSGAIAIRLALKSYVPWYVSLLVMIAGPIIGAWSQVKSGDTLWKNGSGKWW